MVDDDDVRPELYRRFEHPTPQWFTDAKLGFFVHWGPYSVPAWAEPTGELGTVEMHEWMRHNPYAEWYANTIRIAGSPAQQHHREVYGDADYYDFLDEWDASRFDPDELMALFARAGGRYFIPTTKHHDGVTLWDAPGNPKLNTVARGPRRDLVKLFADAARGAGLKFGTYYSGGLDWAYAPMPPITDDLRDPEDGRPRLPTDAAYAEYAYLQVVDLIDRYQPDVLWGDIEWPDAGKPDGPFSLAKIFDRFYATTADGVINDRFGQTHSDFKTSEYQSNLAAEDAGVWENCRGVGYSFGYNQLEDGAVSLSGPAAIEYLVDVASRGGRFLLNVGLKADGTLPALQRETLTAMGDWNAVHGAAVHASTPLDSSIAAASDDPWIRWTRTGGVAHAFVDAVGAVTLPVTAGSLDPDSAVLGDSPITATAVDGGIRVELPPPTIAGPSVVSLRIAGA